MRGELVKYSKFLSLVLRHDPSAIGVHLDESGWIKIDVLLPALRTRRPAFTRDLLQEVVETNDKKRFVISEDGTRIRAAQGHSIGVDLGLTPSSPPAELYHGTADRNLPSILKLGLLRGRRDHVHLSADVETATKVGTRHGRPIVLVVRAAAMADADYPFFLSENGVWLTSTVPVEFLTFPDLS